MSLVDSKAGSAAVDPADYNAVVDAVVALQAGGGGSQPVGCVLAAFPVAFSGGPSFFWNHVYDNVSTMNALMALPDGIGFTTPLDGLDGTITITDDGWYALALTATVDPDATWQGDLTLNLGSVGEANIGPTPAHPSAMTVTACVFLPAGAFFVPQCGELVTPTGTPGGIAYLAVTKMA